MLNTHVHVNSLAMYKGIQYSIYNSIIKLIRGSDDGLVVAAIFFIRFKAASYS